MTGPVLAQIYMGKITKWNAPAIKKINKGASLPNKRSRSSTAPTARARPTTSPTTSRRVGSWKSQAGTGTAVTWPTGEGEKGSSGVAGAVRTTPGAIGYVDVYYAVHNHLGLFKMQNRAGNFVQPRAKGIIAAARARHAAREGRLPVDRQSAEEQEVQERVPDLHLHVRGRAEELGRTPPTSRSSSTGRSRRARRYGPPIIFEPLPKAVVTFDKKQIKKIHS